MPHKRNGGCGWCIAQNHTKGKGEQNKGNFSSASTNALLAGMMAAGPAKLYLNEIKYCLAEKRMHDIIKALNQKEKEPDKDE